MTSLYMAPTLSSSSFSSPCPELCTPPPSQHSFLQVPNVFVIPPEEEHDENPPFCCYDAASESKQALSIIPDIDALDVALSFCQQTENRAPEFHRSFFNESQETVVMPRRSERQMRDSPPATRIRGSEPRNVLDDSDVVEVVKVRRNEGLIGEEGVGMKKSKSFRAKATKAFKSLRNLNVAKGGRKFGNTDNGPENTAPVSENEMRPRSSMPSLPRRKSMQLSQFFSSNRNTRSPSFDIPPSPTFPTSPTESDWSPISRSSFTLGDRTNAQSSQMQDSQNHPTLSSKRSFRRRISVLDLQRLFTPSSQAAEKSVPPPPLPLRSEESSPSSPMYSSQSFQREPLPLPRSSSSSSSFLQSVNDAISGSSASLCSPSIPPSPSTSRGLGIEEDEDVIMMGDDSFELRLDSLQFDSLHFDPEEF